MQIISHDKTVKNDTVQDLKEFNSQSLATQAKKGEKLNSMMPAIKKAFNLLSDSWNIYRKRRFKKQNGFARGKMAWRTWSKIVTTDRWWKKSKFNYVCNGRTDE